MSLKPLLRHAFLILAALLMGRSAAQHSTSDSTAHHTAVTTSGAHDAASAQDHGAKEKFNAGKLIMDHIGDEHGWHLWGHTSLPLPVILYNSERGLSLFSSGRFDHGHRTYGGYALHEGQVVAVDAPDGTDAHHAPVNERLTAATVDLSITKNVATLLLVSALLLWVFISVARAYTRRAGQAPTGLQNLVEPIILFVRDDLAKSAIGHKYEKYLPYLLTAFFFIFFSNLLGLVPFFPGGANLTGNIAVTVVLAVMTFLIVTFSGNKHYWHHIFAMPGVPGWVLAILTPVEILGMFLKPFVLAIRLFANITAGHIIALSFFSLIFVFGETSAGAGYGVAIGSWLFTVFMFMLELLVAFIQAYVFTFLSAMYIGAAVEEPHHH
ncbi:MAG: F0F1 ATP synthase subunit A [Flavobacteriales bacterium]|jgi:F-type H+-transporting ATPase subunit a|nr:F0F1 ATP synthase subunit A [Flavobacteriales bacterium]MBK7942962.1 F0F1 ATP synthase subunit A [Flavobacteriales bacterium]MBK9698639.1 F0F1 ATP synthase subunit A [Flavobacteriales bacterium]